MELYNYFESYLFGQLSQEERLTFEKKLESDTEFKENFESHKRTQMAMDILVEDDVKKHIATLKDNTTVSSAEEVSKTISDVPRPKSNVAKILSVAALIAAIMLCVSLYLKTNNSEITPIYLAAYQAPIDSSATRSSESPTTIDNYYRFTRPAHDAMATNQYKKAAELFESYLSKYEGRQKQEIEWYLAIALSATDVERSRLLLYDISTTEGHLYLRKAKGLLTN